MTQRIELPETEIVASYQSGLTCQQIASRYGVDTTVIHSRLRSAGVIMRRAGARVKDLAGQRYGRLTVLERAPTRTEPRGYRLTMWRCICDCGNAVIVWASKLSEGATKSCGCLARERNVEAHTRHGHASDRRRTREYKAWEGAKGRCHREKDPGFKNYGARGIRMCDRWRESFEAFLEDMGLCPRDHSIERIDVNGNYEPANCRWANLVEQHSNRRDNRFIEVGGERVTLAQASRRLGVPRHRLESRAAPSQM